MMSQTRTVASMWWCGDYVCDCTQPVVEEIPLSPPFIRRRLWEGSFVSRDSADDLSAERALQWVELIEARSRFNAEQGWRDEDVPDGARRGEEGR
jgi:hypothetical protein